MTRRQRLAKALDTAANDGATFGGLLALAGLTVVAVLIAVTRLAVLAGGQGWEPLVGILTLGAVYLIGRALVQVRRHYRELAE